MARLSATGVEPPARTKTRYAKVIHAYTIARYAMGLSDATDIRSRCTQRSLRGGKALERLHRRSAKAGKQHAAGFSRTIVGNLGSIHQSSSLSCEVLSVVMRNSLAKKCGLRRLPDPAKANYDASASGAATASVWRRKLAGRMSVQTASICARKETLRPLTSTGRYGAKYRLDRILLCVVDDDGVGVIYCIVRACFRKILCLCHDHGWLDMHKEKRRKMWCSGITRHPT